MQSAVLDRKSPVLFDLLAFPHGRHQRILVHRGWWFLCLEHVLVGSRVRSGLGTEEAWVHDVLLLVVDRLRLVDAVLVTGLFEVHLPPGIEECAGATSQKLGVFVELVLALEVIHMQELAR